MKAYICGPMTGKPSYNYPAFDFAAAELRSKGFEVISPSEMDDPELRRLILASPDGDLAGLATAALQVGLKPRGWSDFLADDVKLLADSGIEAIYVLPGWGRSKGARLETFIHRGLHRRPVFRMTDGSRVGLWRLAIAWVFGR